MGKFNGVLLASDFDNTLIYTEAAGAAASRCRICLPEPEALEYFMAEGGRFCGHRPGARRPFCATPIRVQ